jgi:hypothetical protein
MQKKLCLGLGVVLLGVATLLYFSGNVSDVSSIRIVDQAEAKMVLGGGQNGYQTATVDGVICNGGLSGCTGKGVKFQGNQVTGGFVWTGTVFCGGANCSTYWVPASVTTAQE